MSHITVLSFLNPNLDNVAGGIPSVIFHRTMSPSLGDDGEQSLFNAARKDTVLPRQRRQTSGEKASSEAPPSCWLWDIRDRLGLADDAA
jgi:hypothetical protein